MGGEEESEDVCQNKIREMSSSQEQVEREVLVRSMTGKECGNLSHLLRRATRLSRGLTSKLASSQLVGEVKDLLPFLVAEMEKLRALAPDLKRSKEEQKKQAGFIQQRKRAGLNDLFKTLQALGFSYRFGVNNCESVHSYKELFTHTQNGSRKWERTEFYFFCCFARFRQLVPLLDRALPADVSSVLGERFLGFAQHMLHLATQWRESVATGFQRLQDVRSALENLEKGKEWDLSRSGAEYQTLASNALDIIESCAATAEARALEWPDLQELRLVHEKLETLRKELIVKMYKPATAFPEAGARKKVTSWAAQIASCASLLSSISTESTALNPSLKLLGFEISSLGTALDTWLMRHPESSTVADDDSFRSLLDRLIVRSLLGIQQVQKTAGSVLEEEKTWTEAMEDMMTMGNGVKAGSLRICLRRVEAVLASVAGLNGAPFMLKGAQDAALVVKQLSCVAESVQELSVNALLNFTKLLSVILKVFSEIAVHGFCPVKDMEDEGGKSSDDFKSSEEETGLGQGEGAKDVSDQIENEDMLDGAYQDTEEKENKEEDNGIEMSENFESNLQDKNEEEKGDEEEEEKEGELEDESGEVEGNEDLDKDMWGEEEEEKEDNSDLGESEEKGKAEEEKMDELAAKEDIEKSDKNDEKRQRKEEEKEKENEPQEFDDNQTDAEHGKDEKMEEPEAFDLPDNMELDEKEAEDNFEEAAANEPEKMPDFEDENDEEGDEEDKDGNEEDEGRTEIENLADMDEKEEEKLDDVVTKDTGEDMDQDDPNENEPKDEETRKGEQQSGMDVDEEADSQEALEQQSDLDQDKKSKGDEGMNDESK